MLQGSIKFLIANQQPPHGMDGGFASFRLTARYMTVAYHDQDGVILYTTPPMLPRQ